MSAHEHLQISSGGMNAPDEYAHAHARMLKLAVCLVLSAWVVCVGVHDIALRIQAHAVDNWA